MVGNAVPVQFAKAIGQKITEDLQEYLMKNVKSYVDTSNKEPLSQYFEKIQEKMNIKYRKIKKIESPKRKKRK